MDWQHMMRTNQYSTAISEPRLAFLSLKNTMSWIRVLKLEKIKRNQPILDCCIALGAVFVPRKGEPRSSIENTGN